MEDSVSPRMVVAATMQFCILRINWIIDEYITIIGHNGSCLRCVIAVMLDYRTVAKYVGYYNNSDDATIRASPKIKINTSRNVQ